MRTLVGTTVIAAFVGAGLAGGPAPARADDKTGMAISAGKVAKNPEKFIGKQVTVRAEVEDVLGPNMFTLDEDALLAGPDVLVMVPGGLASTLTHDQKVVVTGEVRPYVEADLDRDFDFFERGKLVDVKTKVDWKTRPVIVARSIRSDTGTELLKGAARETHAGHVAHATHAGHEMSATPASLDTTAVRAELISAGKLAKDPQSYYGREVAVRAEVEDVLGPNMFTLDEDALLAGPDVLVMVPGGLASTLAHDQKVVVTGEVRPYVEADLDRDFDFFERGKLVDVKTKVDWKTRPVVVARSIKLESGAELIR